MNKRQKRKLLRRLRKFGLLLVILTLSLSLTNVFAQQISAQDKGVTYIVQPGDTLWGIASEHRGNTEIRRYIDKIRKQNSLSNQHIIPGQILELP